ncbi:hypothetical protein BDR22DRAFT_820514 [Usnea florida]
MAPTLPSLSTQQNAPSHQSPPNPAARRIRENQRRSRARRKEYMHEIEHKLRNCEQAGVTASIDIQLAARVVAEENKRLREENGRLRDEGAALREENERLRGVVLEKERGGCTGEGTAEALEAGAAASGIGVGKGEHGPPLQNSTPGHTTTVQSREDYASYFPHRQPEAHSEVPCSHDNNEMALGDDDTSSCEYAAHIITSMRADVSADDVKADLGCGGDVRGWKGCKVDNSRLFVTVDRWVG